MKQTSYTLVRMTRVVVQTQPEILCTSDLLGSVQDLNHANKRFKGMSTKKIGKLNGLAAHADTRADPPTIKSLTQAGAIEFRGIHQRLARVKCRPEAVSSPPTTGVRERARDGA